MTWGLQVDRWGNSGKEAAYFSRTDHNLALPAILRLFRADGLWESISCQISEGGCAGTLQGPQHLCWKLQLGSWAWSSSKRVCKQAGSNTARAVATAACGLGRWLHYCVPVARTEEAPSSFTVSPSLPSCHTEPGQLRHWEHSYLLNSEPICRGYPSFWKTPSLHLEGPYPHLMRSLSWLQWN